MGVSGSDLATYHLALAGTILGAVGTIISGTLAVNELLKNRRAIRITCKELDLELGIAISVGSLAYGAKTISPQPSRGLEIKVLNNGPRPVQLEHAGFLTRDRVLFDPPGAFGSDTLPAKLNFGDTFVYRCTASQLQAFLTPTGLDIRDVNAAVQDAEERWYKASLPKSISQ